jgi:hypothetical protein
MGAKTWRVAQCLGGTGTEGLLGEVNRSAPQRSKASDGAIGDTRHQARSSDHNPCDCCGLVHARDFTNDPKGGFDADRFAEWLRARVQAAPPEARVKYVIWRKRIFSGVGQQHPAGLWRPYGGTNPHTKHVHVSVCHDSSNDAAPWGWPPA